MRRKWIGRAVGAALLVVSLGAASQALQLQFRDQTYDFKGPAAFGRNGEFEVTLPFKRQRVTWGSFGNDRLFAINIDSLASDDHLSVEWVYLDEPMPSEDYLAYWDGLLPDYLDKNFGSGHYALLQSSHVQDADGRARVTFLGTGVGADGKTSSIAGVTTNFGKRMATVYALVPVDFKADAEGQAVAMAAAKSLADSLTCSAVACSGAPEKQQ